MARNARAQSRDTERLGVADIAGIEGGLGGGDRGSRCGGSRLADLPASATAYARTWHRAFAPRQLAASLVARWAMSPVAAGTLPLLRCFPGILTLGARASGKTCRVVYS